MPLFVNTREDMEYGIKLSIVINNRKYNKEYGKFQRRFCDSKIYFIKKIGYFCMDQPNLIIRKVIEIL